MEILTGIYLFYSFLAFYYLFLFILIFIQNRKTFFEFPKYKKALSLSIVIPCYNEGETIGKTIENLLASDYPNLKKIIVVDDCSKDNSFGVMKKYEKMYPKMVLAVQTPSNTGKASGSKNYGAQFVDTELIGFSDADSFPKKDAISKMIGFFNDKEVGAVTSRVLVENPVNFLSRIQALEYRIIAFSRKVLEYIDSIYVTNGPLSIYRKSGFDEVGGFDETNWTEDIEITWNFVKHGWKVRMSLGSVVSTVVPETIKVWFKQRLRWNIGGVQTIKKYKTDFFKCGMLGAFILPFFVSSWILAIVGLGILVYRFSRYLILRYLALTYSVQNQAAVLVLEDFNLNPTILVFFGVLLLVLGFAYNVFALSKTYHQGFQRAKILDYVIYAFFYLLFFPILLITSILKYLKGHKSW